MQRSTRRHRFTLGPSHCAFASSYRDDVTRELDPECRTAAAGCIAAMVLRHPWRFTTLVCYDTHAGLRHLSAMTPMPVYDTCLLRHPCRFTTLVCYDTHAGSRHLSAMTPMPVYDTCLLRHPCRFTTLVCYDTRAGSRHLSATTPVPVHDTYLL